MGCGPGAPPTETAAPAGAGGEGSCVDCHAGIEAPGEAHAAVACEACHVTPLAGAEALGRVDVRRPDDHPDVAANPSHPSTWQGACGGCHPDALARMLGSLHWTQAGVVGATRLLWGAERSVDAPGATLPEMARSGPTALPAAGTPQAPAELVDDLLRRRCLRCHLLAAGSLEAGDDGLYRGAGCAACHVPYADDGRYAGDDAVQADRGTVGRPRRHQLQRPTTSEPCLRCHHGDATGADYVGLFEADAHAEYRVPLADGADRAFRYGRDHHRLTPDLHADAGLACVDCHDHDEVMGTSPAAGEAHDAVPRLAHQAIDIRCASCHGELAGRPPGALPADAPPGVARADDGGWTLTLRNGGDPLPIPASTAAADHPAHDPVAHARLGCAACHAAWAGQAFGLHLHRSEVPTWELWIPRAAQGDPELARRIAEAAALPEADRDGLAPAMTDRITGEPRPGLWAAGRSLRRWEEPALGITADGRFAPLRPRHGTRVTSVGADGLVWLDSVTPDRGDGTGDGRASEPFTPHTTAASGAACTRCHGNPRAAGLGITTTAALPALHPDTVPAPPVTPGARLLTDAERAALLDPSPRQRAAHARALAQLGLLDWLPVDPDGDDAGE